jgi:hypothetical protein
MVGLRVAEGLDDCEAVRANGLGRGLLLALFCRDSDTVGRLGLDAGLRAGATGAGVAVTTGGLRWEVALGAELVLLTVAAV